MRALIVLACVALTACGPAGPPVNPVRMGEARATGAACAARKELTMETCTEYCALRYPESGWTDYHPNLECKKAFIDARLPLPSREDFLQ